ncbi:heme o synthase [Buchnera aphidicola]|uniref:heme o synthase n=1 Tax=Buchnera aphidicola TaxID=9 RepID=UPI002238D4B8|nr:heme o synthase [Buchnera aphidicola]MCW5197530.1 heme o synthase [Buchnera aphidicola (Chaitophorus viminalis)]
MQCVFKKYNKFFFYYFEIIKPRIIIANIFSALAGYFFTLRKNIFYYKIFLAMILGLSCIIACGCVLNNILDIENDKKMIRTKNRVLVKKNISINSAYIFSFFLFFCGSLIFLLFLNKIAYIISLFGLFFYVVIYTILLKKKSQYSTIFGAISGSCPIIIGYFSIENYFNVIPMILFLIHLIWQIPHSYSIYLLHLKDYRKAQMPVFPIVNTFQRTLDHMYFSVIILIFFIFMLNFIYFSNYFYSFIFLFLGIIWLSIILEGYYYIYSYKKTWARKIFKFSIFYIILFNFFICMNFFKFL